VKDLVLLVFIVFIFIGHRHIKPLFNNSIQTIAIGVSLMVTTAFTVYTYMFLPRIDFLPYKVGNNIRTLMTRPEGAPLDSFQMVFIYEKDGKQVELGINELNVIDDTYKFIDRKDKLIKEGYKVPVFDFKLYEEVSGIEYTDSLLSDTVNYKLIIVQKEIGESINGSAEQLAALTTPFVAQGYKVWGLTATPQSVVEPYRHEHQLMYNYYMMDPTPLKSIVRSNPGVVLLKGNTIVKKWSGYAIPSYTVLQKYMK
jgi:hypothetical protein